jgi:hypothetical protein
MSARMIFFVTFGRYPTFIDNEYGLTKLYVNNRSRKRFQVSVRVGS